MGDGRRPHPPTPRRVTDEADATDTHAKRMRDGGQGRWREAWGGRKAQWKSRHRTLWPHHCREEGVDGDHHQASPCVEETLSPAQPWELHPWRHPPGRVVPSHPVPDGRHGGPCCVPPTRACAAGRPSGPTAGASWQPPHFLPSLLGRLGAGDFAPGSPRGGGVDPRAVCDVGKATDCAAGAGAAAVAKRPPHPPRTCRTAVSHPPNGWACPTRR